jgi:hypothetical protein
MAERDFMPYQCEGERIAFPVTAGETFLAGEPVALGAAGTLSEAGDDPSTITGIACHRTPTNLIGGSAGVGSRVTVYRVSKDQVYKTKKFAENGDGTVLVPTLTNVGEQAGLTHSGDDWYVDIGTNNLLAEIVGIRDIDGRDLADPNVLPGAGLWVLFRFII